MAVVFIYPRVTVSSFILLCGLPACFFSVHFWVDICVVVVILIRSPEFDIHVNVAYVLIVFPSYIL